MTDSFTANNVGFKTLNLCYSHKVTSAGLINLSNTVYTNYNQNFYILTYIKTIDLSHCQNISDEGMDHNS